MAKSGWKGEYRGHAIRLELLPRGGFTLKDLWGREDFSGWTQSTENPKDEFRLLIDDVLVESVSSQDLNETLRGELTVDGQRLPVVVHIKFGLVRFKCTARVGQHPVDMAKYY